ncbi:MAG: competence protein competence protein ComFC [Candidatus Kaiserbacteria bacterium]|nr:competence protein competence protein ComFC [Candidatus Kaiserbacteria bacterium]
MLDVIAPPRKNTARIAKIRVHQLTVAPQVRSVLSNEVTTLMSYHAPFVKDIITALKFEQSGRASQLCGRILADYLEEEIQSARTFSPRQILIIPMPLHASRVRERGFNQMERICNTLPMHLRDGTSARIVHNTLVRTRATTPQAQLRRAARLTNLKNAFTVNNPAALYDTHVYLIDDVTTTGATLSEAAKTLRQTRCTVTCIALSRA